MISSTNPQDLIPNLFRDQYTKMTAVLCRHFGLEHIEIAEDIVSDTFLKASELWALNEVPENPEGWLYTVAKNKTKDYFKHQNIFDQKVKGAITPDINEVNLPIELDHSLITDSQLGMLFAISDPIIPVESQVCLALQILCGFSVEEISNALLANKETIKKKLFRARNSLRESNFEIKELSISQITHRLPIVLKTLYLLFNEGYFSKSNNQVIRKELCYEAIRLAIILTDNKTTDTPEVNALLALMCYQSSRLDARIDTHGELVLFEQQHTQYWNTELIDRGNYYLVKATNQQETSKYHLEAAIAYWHTTVNKDDKWKHILDLYNQLLLVEYSPIIALNRTFAFAKVYGKKKGIIEAEKLVLINSSYYFGLLGYLYTPIDKDRAIHFYKEALALTQSTTEKHLLNKRITELSSK